MKQFSVNTTSVEQTEALGAKLAKHLDGGMLLTLSGELGTGKTVFAHGLARGLCVPAGVTVTSPTYVLQHTYRGGRLVLHHLDVYRLRGGAQEWEASGLQECLEEPQAIVCLEWPERVAGVEWPADRLEITLNHVAPRCRRVKFVGTGLRSGQLIAQLKLDVSGK